MHFQLVTKYCCRKNYQLIRENKLDFTIEHGKKKANNLRHHITSMYNMSFIGS